MAKRSDWQKSGTKPGRRPSGTRAANNRDDIPQHVAAQCRVRVNTAGNTFIDFTDQAGRIVRVRFPSAGLPGLIEHFRQAAAAATFPHGAVQLPSTTQSNTQGGVDLNVQRPKQLVLGPHGAFEFGTSVDLSRVLITIHLPENKAVDYLLDIPVAKEILAALAKVIAFVETDHSRQKQ